MGKLFERFNTPILSKSQIKITDHVPAIYISENDQVYCYTGLVSKDGDRRSNWLGTPFYMHGKHSTDKNISDMIRGFYRVDSGCIIIDNYADNQWETERYKLVDRTIRFPASASTYYGVIEYYTIAEDEDLTRKVFGLTYEELNEVLNGYANILGISNDYYHLPRLTRSPRSENFCEMTDLWIPAQFPYITFSQNSGVYSHVSLWGFYEHILILMSDGVNSMFYKAMIKVGVSQKTLSQLLNIYNYSFYTCKKVDRSTFFGGMGQE